MGKIIIILGVVLIVVGLLVSFGLKIPFIGKLPGDFYIKRDNITFYFPLATSILLSILVTIILKLFNR